MATYFINQKITAFANQYRIFEGQADNPGKLIAFAHQKRLALKEKFIFYTEESKQQISFQLQGRKVVDLGSAYDVQDEHGNTVGILKKQFQTSLVRSTWHIYAPEAEETPVVIVQERSVPIAIFRRLWSFIPIISELPFFFKYHFDFIDPRDSRLIGSYNKTTLFRDHYKLAIEDKYLKTIDWRTLVALGVVMDALQSR